MNKTKLSIELEKNNGRVFVCGDIHGMYDEFMKLLEQIEFNFDEDLMICTGDLVDRGPKSLDCFNLSYRTWFINCRGNHEQFCLDCIKEGDRRTYQTHVSNGGQWFYNLPLDVQNVIARDVENMPVAITLNRNGKRYGFVHADIPLYVRSWDELLENLSGISYDTYITQCIWGRSRVRQAMASRWNNHINNHIDGVEEVFIGHTVLHDHKKVGNINFIDTGFVYDGYNKLTIVEI